MELAGYIIEHFQRAAAEPQDDLLSVVATALRLRSNWRNSTALTMMITLFSAGGESTASLIGSAAHVLASRPDIQRQVRENPDLLGAFLEEVLRYEPPFRGHYRHVVNDTTLPGVDLTRRITPPASVGRGQPGPVTLRRSPTSFGWTAQAARGTSALARARTSASAPRSPAWRPGS